MLAFGLSSQHHAGVATRDGRAETPLSLRFLIDTNVVIALEPFDGGMEAGLSAAARLVRLANEQGHRILVHPATRDDLREGKDPSRRAQRLAELAKFTMLDEGPVPAALVAAAGPSEPGSNDHRDLRLLAALYNKAATYLISDDAELRKRASRAQLGDLVLTLNEAGALLEGFVATVSAPPPQVERVASYALDGEQQIFGSLRQDYDDFDGWLDRVRAEPDNRDCLIVFGDNRCYAALTLVKKNERDCEYGFNQPVAKISTFTVAAQYSGSKYGELMLKALLGDAHAGPAASLYVEVLDKYPLLVDLFREFGFTDSGHRTQRNELVLVKQLVPGADALSLPPLAYHITFGPPAIHGAGQVFMVPIREEWHRQLFPDAPRPEPEEEQELLPGMEVRTHPWGNALRKAYLCNSRVQRIEAGDTLLFYRSGTARSVSAVGVVEATMRSDDPDEVVNFVGRRTVYTPAEIAAMCQGVDGVLAIRFRQDRFMDPAWTLAELLQERVVTSWPQSITQVRGAGAAWVHQQLGA